MQPAREAEIDRNYDYFQRNLARFLKQHSGQYALLKDAAVIEWFERPGDAYRAGLAQFVNEPFSIQEARSEPIELGHLSFGPN